MSLPPRHILACTDLSLPSDAAERRAASLARAHGARLTLLTVLPASPLRDAADFVADRYFPKDEPRFDPKRVEAEYLERVGARAVQLAAAEGVECEPQLRVGRPARAIAAAARDLSADLVVAGQRGAHGLASTMLGTTTQKLLQSAPCPVLVVKRPSTEGYATVLLPTDLSDASADAIRRTQALFPSATLHIAHAFELPYEGLMNYASVDDATVSGYVAEAARHLQAELARIPTRAALAHRRVTLHLEHGYPPEQIDRWLARLKPDLIAVAAHGTGELERLFLGSVSLHVVQSASCDVLLVRGAGEQ